MSICSEILKHWHLITVVQDTYLAEYVPCLSWRFIPFGYLFIILLRNVCFVTQVVIMAQQQ